MAVIAAYSLNDDGTEPTGVSTGITAIQPAGVLVYKGLVLAAPSLDERAVNPTLGTATTG